MFKYLSVDEIPEAESKADPYIVRCNGSSAKDDDTRRSENITIGTQMQNVLDNWVANNPDASDSEFEAFWQRMSEGLWPFLERKTKELGGKKNSEKYFGVNFTWFVDKDELKDEAIRDSVRKKKLEELRGPAKIEKRRSGESLNDYLVRTSQ